MTVKRLLTILTAASFILATLVPCLHAQKAPKSLTIIYSNNINGELDPCPSWNEKNRLGGLAKRVAWVKEVQETEKNLLMLDAGDLFFKKNGSSTQENNSNNSGPKAHLILESLNLMGYDAMAIGDDDLTLGKDFLSDLAKKANFPFLSSNVMDEASGKPLFHSTLVKEVNGFRIGMFSLLAPEAFLGPEDVRKKGLTIKPPAEVAQAMVKELQPKTDFIFLLSHLGYPKDMELAQAVSGIHLIIGAHTGMNLVYPPVVKNTILLQTASKGMYIGKLDLTILNDDLSFFFNVSTKRTLENTLRNVTAQLGNAKLAEAEKKQLQKSKEDIEKRLAQLQGKNEFTNRVFPLTEQMKDHPEIAKLIEEYRSKYPELPKPVSPQ